MIRTPSEPIIFTGGSASIWTKIATYTCPLQFTVLRAQSEYPPRTVFLQQTQECGRVGTWWVSSFSFYCGLRKEWKILTLWLLCLLGTFRAFSKMELAFCVRRICLGQHLCSGEGIEAGSGPLCFSERQCCQLPRLGNCSLASPSCCSLDAYTSQMNQCCKVGTGGAQGRLSQRYPRFLKSSKIDELVSSWSISEPVKL